MEILLESHLGRCLFTRITEDTRVGESRSRFDEFTLPTPLGDVLFEKNCGATMKGGGRGFSFLFL